MADSLSFLHPFELVLNGRSMIATKMGSQNQDSYRSFQRDSLNEWQMKGLHPLHAPSVRPDDVLFRASLPCGNWHWFPVQWLN